MIRVFQLFQRTPAHTWLSLVALLSCCAITACTPPKNLPPLPDVSTANLLPDIANQLKTLRAQVENTPTDAGANSDYGLALATYGRDREASVLLSRARLLEPRNSQWAYYHSFVLRRLGQPDDALAAIESALTQEPNQIDYQVKKGQLLFDLGDFDTAQQQFTKSLSQRARYPLAQFYLGRIHMVRQEWNLAIEQFKKLLAQGVNIEEVHFNLSQAYRRSGNSALSNRHLAISQQGSTVEVDGYDPMYVVLANLNVGDQPHSVRATELYRRGKIDQAVEEMTRAYEKNPDNIGTHTHLVRMYGHQGNLERALFHYEAAKRIDPDFNQLDANLGFAYQYANNPAMAAEAYTRAVALNPTSATLRAKLGNMLYKAEEPAKAVEHLTESLTLDPGNRTVQVLLARLFNEQRLYKQATPLLEQSLEPVDHSTIEVLRLLSTAQAGLGERAKAQNSLERAIDIAEQYGDTRLADTLKNDLSAL